MLKALAAKAGLQYEEMVGAYARRNSKISNDLLVVKRDGLDPVYTCGESPHFIAKALLR